jgi:predicted 2-oxoglutarate/Fe(II)-dependent dioxygenase YbiX
MLRISRDASHVDASTAQMTRLRAHFDRHHWAKLPAVLSRDLLADVQARLARAEFVERAHPGVVPPSLDLSMVPSVLSGLLELVFNDAAVFDVVERVTGCDPLARFGGFVYRLTPTHGLAHHWHNDLIESRLVAMSVNLGPGTYDGGLLELRDRASTRVIERVPNLGHGDALLFRLHETLQHQACPVIAGVKTAFAGWFFGEDSYPRHLREVAARRQQLTVHL